jgi:hypothetical protein
MIDFVDWILQILRELQPNFGYLVLGTFSGVLVTIIFRTYRNRELFADHLQRSTEKLTDQTKTQLLEVEAEFEKRANSKVHEREDVFFEEMIAKMESVADKLVRISAMTYLMIPFVSASEAMSLRNLRSECSTLVSKSEMIIEKLKRRNSGESGKK